LDSHQNVIPATTIPIPKHAATNALIRLLDWTGTASLGNCDDSKTFAAASFNSGISIDSWNSASVEISGSGAGGDGRCNGGGGGGENVGGAIAAGAIDELAIADAGDVEDARTDSDRGDGGATICRNCGGTA